MDKNIGNNISKNLSDKYCQKRLDYPKQSATDALKTASKRAIQKTAGATVDLTGNKLMINLQRSHEVHHRIVQRQLIVKQEYQKIYIYLQSTGRKLLMMED